MKKTFWAERDCLTARIYDQKGYNQSTWLSSVLPEAIHYQSPIGELFITADVDCLI